MLRLHILSSLKTRIATFATLLFVAAIWAMAFHSAERLREDERRLLSAQQLAAAGFVADGIEAQLRLHIEALGAAAAGIRPAWIGDSPKLKSYLRERQTLYRIFPSGVSVIGKDGRQDIAHPNGIQGATDYGNEDYFRAVMTEGHAAVGRPRIDGNLQQAAVVVAVPITDERNAAIAVLAGAQPIAGSDIFRVVTRSRMPASGHISVISPRDGLVVVESRGTQILEPLPPAGANRLYDRILADAFQGSDIVVDAQGTEWLASAAAVPGTGWFVVDSMPTSQAFAPIQSMTDELYRQAAILSVIVAVLIWLFVRRELSALGRSAKALNEMTSGHLPFRPLRVEGSEEIARMVESFNDLQEQIGRQQAALRASETRFRQMFEGSFWITYFIDPATRKIVDANRAAVEFWGYSAEELQGMDIARIDISSPEEIDACIRNALHDEPTNRTWHHRLKNGELRDVETFMCPLAHGNRTLLYVVAFDVTEKKRMAELVWRQANYDTLTGLPNRNLFYDRLHHEVRKTQRSGQSLALLYIDLDRFKEVNDAYGHDAGDALLKEAASRIAACVRDTDTVARLSGDEFAVVLPGVVDTTRVEQVAGDVVARLGQSFCIGERTAFVSGSVGIAVYPNDANNAEALVKAADSAMYAAKEGGRNGFRYFNGGV